MEAVIEQAVSNKERNAELRSALEAIRKRNTEKLLLPGDVVDEARHPDSPLHSHFTWDDNAAAEKYRLEEARQLIRKVTIEYDPRWGEKFPAFVSLGTDRQREGGGYRKTQDVVYSKKMREQLVATAKAELQGWINRHQLLTELVDKVADAAGLEKPKRPKPK